jgi:TonB-dependent receptor
MPKFMKIGLLLMVWVCAQLLGTESGTLTLYTLKDGVGLTKSEVLVDKDHTYYTDSDGSLHVTLETGTHQVEIYAKDTSGNHLGYFKKPVIIKTDRDTEVVAVFNSNEAKSIKIDTPLESAQSAYQKFDPNHVGTLQGSVLTSDKALPIANARVFVKGTAIDARTDLEGRFSIHIPADVNVSISVVHSEYSAQTINNIVVKKDAIVSQKISLTPASMELEEFVVLAPKVQGSIASIMQEEKQSKSISNILGSEDMTKKGDSDAASALRRVTGVTIIGGKNIYVRGLGDRYSNVEMNSMPLPSPDPTKRTVPLDIFPSGVISSLKVQKSATADIPANFGGGYVDIRTKDKANDNYFKVMMELKGNSNTGKEVNTYQGGGSDWLGFDDGYRGVPSEILNESKVIVGEPINSFDIAHGYTQEQLDGFTKSIVDRQLTTTKNKLPFGGKLGIEGAYNFEVADEHKVSIFGNYTYGQEHTYEEESYYKYAYNRTDNKLYDEPEQYGNIMQTLDQYTHAVLFNVGYNFADVFRIKYTKLYTHTAEGVTNIADGIANSDDDWKIRYDLNWEERTLNVDQISGDFAYNLYGVENDFKFGFESAVAKLNQPGNYKYAYLRDLGFDGSVQGDPFLHRYTANVFLNMTSDDDLTAFYLSNKIHMNLLSEDDYIDIGFSTSSKYRESRYNKYQMDQGNGPKMTEDIDTIYDNNIRNNTGLFDVNIAFQPAYWFDAEVDENSFYVNTFLKANEHIELLLGLKQVDWKQVVYQYTNNNDALAPIEKVPEDLALNDLFPSLGIKLIFDENNQVDIALSKTFIVPDLREFTSAEYFHPYEVATVKGNPDLLNTIIMSYDLKYSHYFSSSENLTLGLFYKDLDKPIEDVMLVSSSLDRYSFDNADSATLYGFELDGRKNLDFLNEFLSHYYIAGNFSYADSDVSLREEQLSLYTSNHRQLQGLSQTVVNLTIGFDNKARSLTLSYNKMGERIRKVGMIDGNDKYPDYYENPAELLDFVWIEKFTDTLNARLKVGNILDGETTWTQGGNVTNKFKTGTTYSAGISYKF